MTNKDYPETIASEFKWDEKKLIERITNEKFPEFSPKETFKEKLDTKIQDKINLAKEQKTEQATMDAIPRKLKWRFYLTWYSYAVVSFWILFLIWFCTNIFTWTLKVPEKYTFLEENRAFGNLTYNYGENIASNYIYYDDADYEEESIDMENTWTNTDKSINTNSSIKNIIKTEWKSATISARENTWEDKIIWDFWLNKFAYNETYRFAYKNKLFPKLAEEYPIYKTSWVLMWSNTPNQVLKNLKIWNVSFKNFQDLEIMNIEIEENSDNWYNIVFDNRSQKLHFYPNKNWKSNKYDGKLPSKKHIIKDVEKNLKLIWISTKNYGNWLVDFENYDENMWIIQIFYPFKIQWKSVWNGETNQQIWINISYDLNLEKIVSIIWIDIATYDVSNYPTLEKSQIEYWIEQWWEYYTQWALHENSKIVLFDSMDVVYITKLWLNWETIYVPAIRWTVSTSIENYNWPEVIFQELVN